VVGVGVEGPGTGTVGAGTDGTGTVGTGVDGTGTGRVGAVTLTVGSGGTWAPPDCTSTCAAANPLKATIRPSSLPSHVIRRRPPDRGVCHYNEYTLERGAAKS
jgi:hypothetical protein